MKKPEHIESLPMFPRLDVEKGNGSSHVNSLLMGPMTPRLVQALKIDNPFPSGEEFFPSGAWQQTWRISSNSWSPSQKIYTGYIDISRIPSGDEVRYKIIQVLVYQEGMHQIQNAELICLDNIVSTLVHWNVYSKCYDKDQRLLPKFSWHIEGVFDEDTYLDLKNKIYFILDAPLVSQWQMYDIVQRMKTKCLKFLLLEHVKENRDKQCLLESKSMCPEHTPDGESLKLYMQCGRGVIPWEYWRDEHGRIIYAFNLMTMHILDSHAIEKTEQLLNKLAK